MTERIRGGERDRGRTGRGRRRENESQRTGAHGPGTTVSAVKYLRHLSYEEKILYLAHDSRGSSPKSGSPSLRPEVRVTHYSGSSMVEQRNHLHHKTGSREETERPRSPIPLQGHALGDLGTPSGPYHTKLPPLPSSTALGTTTLTPELLGDILPSHSSWKLTRWNLIKSCI